MDEGSPESYPYLLGEALGVSIENAGVPAMKPNHIASWLKSNIDQFQNIETVLFARRIDWGQPNPWESYFKAIQDSINATAKAKFVLVLPPISTFDPRGLLNQKEELQRLRKRFPGLPIIELTPAFRKAAPPKGIRLAIEGSEQRLIDNPTKPFCLRSRHPFSQKPCASEITDYFESTVDL